MRRTLLITLLTPLLCCSACSPKVDNDVNSYESILKTFREESDFHTELYIFPESTSIGTPLDFKSQNTESLFTGSFLLYLRMQFDQQTFNSELTRISNVEAIFKKFDSKKIIHFPEQSLYLTIAKDNRYEYAMYNEQELTITYVSNQLYQWKETNIENQYILPSVTIPEELDDEDNSYNMYYFYVNEFGHRVGYYVND